MNTPRLEVSVIIDPANDTEAFRSDVAAAISHAGELYSAQLHIDLVPILTDTANPATHTNPAALLDAVSLYRQLHDIHMAADVTVFFTDRLFYMGSTQYVGMATLGDSCRPGNAAIISMQHDGTDAQTVAHEIGHTLDIQHDAQPGWLMSPNSQSSDYFSPESLATAALASRVCMYPAAVVEVPKVKTPAHSEGGGGSFDPGTLLALAVLAIFVALRRNV